MLPQPAMNGKPKGTEHWRHRGPLANAINLGTPCCLRLPGRCGRAHGGVFGVSNFPKEENSSSPGISIHHLQGIW